MRKPMSAYAQWQTPARGRAHQYARARVRGRESPNSIQSFQERLTGEGLLSASQILPHTNSGQCGGFDRCHSVYKRPTTWQKALP